LAACAVVVVGIWSGAPAQETPQDSTHPPGCSDLAGSVTREVMERPELIRHEAGRLHQKVTTSSAEAQAFYDQGVAYLASYVWVEASRSFHEALRRDPDLAMAHLGLAKAYMGVDARDDARRHLGRAGELARPERAIAVTPQEAKWIALGAQQFAAVEAPEKEQAAAHQKYKKAIEDLIAMDPEDPHAWVLRGNAEEPGAWGRGQAGGVGSIAYYEAALARDPAHLGAHHFLVHSYENIGRHAEAAEHGKVYAAAAPGVPHARHMYGHVLPRLGRWTEALEQFSAADRLERDYYASEKIEPEDDWHHGHNLHLLGTINLRLGNDAEAQRLLKEAFDLKSRDPKRGGRYAAPYLEYLILRGRFTEALDAARLLESSPSSMAKLVGTTLGGEALLGLGRADEARRSLKTARSLLKEVVDEAKRTPYATFIPSMMGPFLRTLEGEVGLRGRKPTEAEKALLKMADDLAANPRFDAWGEGLFRLERIASEARRAGRPDLAVKLAERMRKIDPEFPTTAAAVSAASQVR